MKVTVKFQTENPYADIALGAANDDANELINEAYGVVETVHLAPFSTQTLYMTITAEVDDSKSAEDNPAANASGERRHRYFVVPKTLIFEAESEISYLGLRIRCCRSVMRPSTSHIVFDECEPGNVYEKELPVWNRSEGPLTFRASSISFNLAGRNKMPVAPEEEGSLIQLFDYETDRPFPSTGIISKAYAQKRLRVKFAPTATGDCDAVINFENMYAESENLRVHVHASVRRGASKLKPKIRVEDDRGNPIAGQEALSFGDGYCGEITSRAVVVENLTSRRIDIYLSSNCEREVSFAMPNLRARDSMERCKG